MKPRGEVWTWYHVVIEFKEGPLAGRCTVMDVVADGVAHAKEEAIKTYGHSSDVTGIYRQGRAKDFYKAKRFHLPVFFEEEVDEHGVGIR